MLETKETCFPPLQRRCTSCTLCAVHCVHFRRLLIAQSHTRKSRYVSFYFSGISFYCFTGVWMFQHTWFRRLSPLSCWLKTRETCLWAFALKYQNQNLISEHVSQLQFNFSTLWNGLFLITVFLHFCLHWKVDGEAETENSWDRGDYDIQHWSPDRIEPWRCGFMAHSGAVCVPGHSNSYKCLSFWRHLCLLLINDCVAEQSSLNMENDNSYSKQLFTAWLSSKNEKLDFFFVLVWTSYLRCPGRQVQHLLAPNHLLLRHGLHLHSLLMSEINRDRYEMWPMQSSSTFIDIINSAKRVHITLLHSQKGFCEWKFRRLKPENIFQQIVLTSVCGPKHIVYFHSNLPRVQFLACSGSTSLNMYFPPNLTQIKAECRQGFSLQSSICLHTTSN